MPDDNDTAPDGLMEFEVPNTGGWYYTIMRDWIPLCPELTDVAIRVYWIVRSIMHEKGEHKRRLSVDQLCWLVPGPKGKPSGKTRIEDALRVLENVGLLSNPDGDVVRRWVYDTSTGKRQKENYRRWKVHDYPDRQDLPPEGYGGWRSAIAKLDAYPGPQWRHEVVDNSTSEGGTGTETRNSGSQAKPKRSPAQTNVSAGHDETRNSGSTHRNSGSTHRNSGAYNPVTCTKSTLKESLQGSSISNSSSSGHSDDAAPSTTGRHATPEEEEETNTSQSTTPTNEQGGGDADASTDPTSIEARADTSELFKRFWACMPQEATPNKTQRLKLNTQMQGLFLDDDWADGDGPEILAARLRERLPRERIASAAKWVTSQLPYMPAGPSEADLAGVVPHGQCPEGCDDNYWFEGWTGIVYPCSVPHTRSGAWKALKHGQDRHTRDDAPSPDDHPEESEEEIQRRIQKSFDSAPGIVPAGVGAADIGSDGAWQPPF